MNVNVNGAQVHLSTGGKEFDAAQPTVLFLHGSGLDHRAWALQTRWFAYNGYSVLAPDFPGHSLSDGSPIKSIEASADWLRQVLSELNISQAHVVGHSQGFLSALELAKQSPDSVLSLVGVGTASVIPVNQMLIDTALKSAAQAANLMLQWGFGPRIHMGVSPTPGMQPIAIGKQIISANPLAEDLQACANYAGGGIAMQSIKKPCALILGDQDKMTPLKSGLATARALQADVDIIKNVGHMLPIEAPKRVLTALRLFINQHSVQG